MRVLLFARGAFEQRRWVEFPLGLPNIESDGLQLLDRIAYIPQQKRQGQLLIGDIDSPVTNLKQYVPQDSTPEELNTLAIKIKYLTPEALVCFEAALELNEIKSMKDILRIADTLDQYEMYLDVSTMGELGRYLVRQGIVEFPDEVCPYLDFEKIGIEYDAEHTGTFCGTSYVTQKEGAPGLTLDAGRTQIFKVHLYTGKVGDTMPGSYRLILPACEERLEQVKQLIGVDDFAEARIEQVEYPLTLLQEYLPRADCPSVETLNALAEEIEELLQTDGELLKLCGVLEVERPQTLNEALRLTRNLDDYERIPCGHRPDEYGRYVMRYPEQFEIEDLLEDLESFVDEDGYGQYRMREDGVRVTDCGLIRRLSEPFPTQESGMEMRQS